MHRWFWKSGRLLFRGQNIHLCMSRDFSRGPRLFWPLNCPERSLAPLCVLPAKKIISRTFRISKTLIVIFVLESFPNPGFYRATMHFKLIQSTDFLLLCRYRRLLQPNSGVYPACPHSSSSGECVRLSLRWSKKNFNCIQFCRGTKIACLLKMMLYISGREEGITFKESFRLKGRQHENSGPVLFLRRG
jgi:hypothetical protein